MMENSMRYPTLTKIINNYNWGIKEAVAIRDMLAPNMTIDDLFGKEDNAPDEDGTK